jgi:EAL domain-containing protein (putative c-di-GMP-specific phosphodiesterase class I)
VGLDPKYLELELTESVILENGDDIQRQLQDIRDMGVSLAIDDFGTGYSNLSYLSRLNVQKLKVDQYFVMNLLKSDSDRTIVHAITHIASSFGMKTVAEGVEDAALIEPLLDLHCTIGQGYLWSKPVPLDSFMTLLNDYSPTKQLAEATA